MTDEHATPWYRRTYRWGQTNLTEVDPLGVQIVEVAEGPFGHHPPQLFHHRVVLQEMPR